MMRFLLKRTSRSPFLLLLFRLLLFGIAAILWPSRSRADLVPNPTRVYGLGAMYGVAFSPDGKRVAASCHDGHIVIFDKETGDWQLVLEGDVGTGDVGAV